MLQLQGSQFQIIINFFKLYAFGNFDYCCVVAEGDELELTSPITRKKLELQFVSLFTYKFTITSLNFKLRENRVIQQCH